MICFRNTEALESALRAAWQELLYNGPSPRATASAREVAAVLAQHYTIHQQPTGKDFESQALELLRTHSKQLQEIKQMTAQQLAALQAAAATSAANAAAITGALGSVQADVQTLAGDLSTYNTNVEALIAAYKTLSGGTDDPAIDAVVTSMTQTNQSLGVVSGALTAVDTAVKTSDAAADQTNADVTAADGGSGSGGAPAPASSPASSGPTQPGGPGTPLVHT